MRASFGCDPGPDAVAGFSKRPPHCTLRALSTAAATVRAPVRYAAHMDVLCPVSDVQTHSATRTRGDRRAGCDHALRGACTSRQPTHGPHARIACSEACVTYWVLLEALLAGVVARFDARCARQPPREFAWRRARSGMVPKPRTSQMCGRAFLCRRAVRHGARRGGKLRRAQESKRRFIVP